MLLKRADDKSKRLALLEDLQKSTLLDARQKKWLREELSTFRKGIQGEKESAHYLDSYFKDGDNHVLLHDLRFVVDGDVAQIDHLIINRLGFFYLIETKNYACHVSINGHGEFTAEYEDAKFGVASPIEQSHRHERVLRKLCERLDITTRLGTSLEFHHVVMFHPKAVIERPPLKEFDTTNVIKADQFPTWHKKFADKIGIGEVLKGFANIRSLDAAKEWGEKLMRQHRPADLLSLPEFIAPKQRPETIKPIVTKPTVQPPDEGKRRLICLQCNTKITFPEGKFCWNNEARFKGGQYCREHQALF